MCEHCNVDRLYHHIKTCGSHSALLFRCILIQIKQGIHLKYCDACVFFFFCLSILESEGSRDNWNMWRPACWMTVALLIGMSRSVSSLHTHTHTRAHAIPWGGHSQNTFIMVKHHIGFFKPFSYFLFLFSENVLFPTSCWQNRFRKRMCD